MENQNINDPVQGTTKNNKPMIIALIAIGVVVLIGVIVGISLAIKRPGSESINQTGTMPIVQQNIYLDDVYANPTNIKELKVKDFSEALGYSSDGSKIAILTDEKVLDIYDTTTLKSVKQIENVSSCSITNTANELVCSVETYSDTGAAQNSISDILAATKTDSDLKIFDLKSLSFSDSDLLSNLPRRNDKALGNTVDSINLLGSDDTGTIWQISTNEIFTDPSVLSDQERAKAIGGFGIHSINHQSLLKIKDGKVTWIREINSEQTPGCGLADNNSKILCLSEGGIGDPSTVRVYDQKSGDELFSKEITGHVTVTNQGWVVEASNIGEESELSTDLSSTFEIYDFAGNKSSAKGTFTGSLTGPFPSATWSSDARVAYNTTDLLGVSFDKPLIDANGKIVGQTSVGTDAVQRVKGVSGGSVVGSPISMTADGATVAVLELTQTQDSQSDLLSDKKASTVKFYSLKDNKEIFKFDGSPLMTTQNGVLWCVDGLSVSLDEKANVTRVFVVQK